MAKRDGRSIAATSRINPQDPPKWLSDVCRKRVAEFSGEIRQAASARDSELSHEQCRQLLEKSGVLRKIVNCVRSDAPNGYVEANTLLFGLVVVIVVLIIMSTIFKGAVPDVSGSSSQSEPSDLRPKKQTYGTLKDD